MLLLAFLMLIPGVETKETPVKCEYPDEKKVNECLQVRIFGLETFFVGRI